MRIRLMIISLLLALPAQARPVARTAVELYEQGLRQMQRGSNTKALESFQRVRNYHRDDPISVKAQLAIADVYFKKRDYEQARFAYEEFSAYHPRHENLDYVTWRIGLCVYKRASKFAGRDQAPTRSAINVWSGFERRFPDSKHLEEVSVRLEKSRERLASKEMFIARFYKRKKAWGAVAGRATYTLRRYKSTSRQAEALFLLGSAKHKWGMVEEAKGVVERLESVEDGEKYLRKLQRVLAKAPGEKPNEKIFIRPYRIRGLVPGA